MKQTKREKIDELFKEAAKQSLDDMIDEYPSLEELEGNYEFSHKHNKKMERLFKKAYRTEENADTDLWHRFRRLSFNAAALICMLFTILTLVAFTVPDIRIAITNYVVMQNEDHTVINTTSDIYNGEVIEEVPRYIPNKFILLEYTIGEGTVFARYTDDKEGFIHYTRTKGNSSINLDNEDTKIERLKIREFDGFVFEKNGVATIIFHDTEYTYLLSATVSRKELIKIAESIIE